MIVYILFLFLFLVIVGLLTIFVFSIFIPAISQDGNHAQTQKYLLAADELRNCSSRKKSLCDTGQRAVVLCSHEKEFSQRRINYQGPRDCVLFTKLYETEYDCFQQCLGFGTCTTCCPQRAIQIVNNTAVVLAGCIGCGRCVSVCPKHIIKLVPKNSVGSQIICSNTQGDTTCTACQREKKAEIPPRNVFKLWKLCYTILYGRKRQE